MNACASVTVDCQGIGPLIISYDGVFTLHFLIIVFLLVLFLLFLTNKWFGGGSS